jgi:hypothetical protein
MKSGLPIFGFWDWELPVWRYELVSSILKELIEII